MEKAFSLSKSNLTMLRDFYMGNYREEYYEVAHNLKNMDREKAAGIECEIITAYIKKMLNRGRGYEASVNVGHYFAGNFTFGELVDRLLTVDSAESAESEE